jgi:hypothetical protein
MQSIHAAPLEEALPGLSAGSSRSRHPGPRMHRADVGPLPSASANLQFGMLAFFGMDPDGRGNANGRRPDHPLWRWWVPDLKVALSRIAGAARDCHRTDDDEGSDALVQTTTASWDKAASPQLGCARPATANGAIYRVESELNALKPRAPSHHRCRLLDRSRARR